MKFDCILLLSTILTSKIKKPLSIRANIYDPVFMNLNVSQLE